MEGWTVIPKDFVLLLKLKIVNGNLKLLSLRLNILKRKLYDTDTEMEFNHDKYSLASQRIN